MLIFYPINIATLSDRIASCALKNVGSGENFNKLVSPLINAILLPGIVDLEVVFS